MFPAAAVSIGEAGAPGWLEDGIIYTSELKRLVKSFLNKNNSNLSKALDES